MIFFIVIKLLAALDNNHPAAQIAKRLQYRNMPKIVRLDHFDLAAAQHLLDNFKQQNTFQDWQLIIIKTPHQSYKVEEDPILVLTEQGKVKPINEISMMINAISDKNENTAFLCIDYAIWQDPKVQHIVNKLMLEEELI